MKTLSRVFPSDTRKLAFCEHLPYKIIISNQEDLSPNRPNNAYAVPSLVSTMNGLFKTIFYLNLSYQHNDYYLP